LAGVFLYTVLGLWLVWAGYILLILLEFLVELMEQFWLALIVSVFAPAIMAFITNYNARVMKRMDYKRQDEMEERAEKARKLLLARQEEASVKADTNTNRLLTAQKVAANTAIVTLAVGEAIQAKLGEMDAKIDQKAENHAPPNSN
jgi:hypothetical protein